MSLWNTVNKVCKELPIGWQVNLCMENGAAWIECRDPNRTLKILPDATDTTLQYQLNEALVVALKDAI